MTVRVGQLWHYPVKSMQGEPTDEVTLADLRPHRVRHRRRVRTEDQGFLGCQLALADPRGVHAVHQFRN